MKIIKLLIAALLIFAGLMLLGETRLLNAAYSLESKFPHAEYKNKIANYNNSIAFTAEEVKARTGCEIFFIQYNYPSNLKTDVIIYCRPEAQKEVEAGFSLGNIEFKSLMAGTLKIEFQDIPEIPAIDGKTTVCFWGNEESITTLHEELSAEFGEVYFQWAYFDNRYNIAVYLFFSVIIVIITVLSIYDSEFQKKEVIIRISLGTSKQYFYLKNLVIDSLAYLCIMCMESIFIMRINNLSDVLNSVVIICIILIICNSAAYLGLLRFDYSLVLRGQKLISKILSANYVLKFAVSLSSIFVISLFCSAATKLYEHTKANNFFSELEGYSFCNFQNAFNINDMDAFRERYREVNETIYRDYYNQCNPILLKEMGCDNQNSSTLLYANSNTKEYLQSVLPEWSGNVNSNVIVFIPYDFIGNNDKTAEALKILKNIEGSSFKYSYETVYLKHDYQIISINSDLDEYFEFKKNPIVILNTVAANKMPLNITETNHFSMYRNIIYKMDEKTAEEISEKFYLDQTIITDCLTLHNYYSYINRVKMIFWGTFSALIIAVEIVLLGTIIRLEFCINATELCLKKILGYSIAERYGNFFVYSILTSAVCIGISILISVNYNMLTWRVVLLIGIGIILTEILLILINIRLVEGANINKVLKGGAL